jgi:hypothetical protein
MLAVIQDKQDIPASQPAHKRVLRRAALLLTQAKGGGHRRPDHRLAGHRDQVDIPGAVGIPVGHIAGHDLGQASLADSTRADGSDQTMRPERVGQHGPLGGPANKRRQRRRPHPRPGSPHTRTSIRALTRPPARGDTGQRTPVGHTQLAQ